MPDPIYSLTNLQGRTQRVLFMVAVALLLFAPLLAAIYFRLEHLTYANESLAYRYFYTLRILAGEQGVWAAQGFTLSTIQILIHVIAGSLSVDIDQLRGYLDLFGFVTNGLIAAFHATVLVAAIQSRHFTVSDRLLVILSILAPIYATGSAGIYYNLLPDYYSLNVALNSLALLLFILGVRKQSQFPSWMELFGVSMAAGAMIANKVSMLPVAAMMLLPWVLAGTPLRWSVGLARASFVGFSSLAVSAIIVFSFFLFDFGSFVVAASSWKRFVFNPGTEPNFWATLVASASAYNYHWTAVIASCVFVFALLAMLAQIGMRAWTMMCMLGVLMVAVIWGYFIWKRPANTTLFEANNALIVVMSALAVLPISSTVRRNLAVGMTISIALVSVFTFPIASQIELLRISRESGDNRWNFFNEVRRRSGDDPVTVILASNEYGHGGVHELLLKGMSTPPTWEVGDGGQKALKRLGLHITFKHYYSGVGEFCHRLPAGSWILWFEKPGLQEIQKMTPPLARLISQGAPLFSWNLPRNNLLPAMDAYMVKVPDHPVEIHVAPNAIAADCS